MSKSESRTTWLKYLDMQRFDRDYLQRSSNFMFKDKGQKTHSIIGQKSQLENISVFVRPAPRWIAYKKNIIVRFGLFLFLWPLKCTRIAVLQVVDHLGYDGKCGLPYTRSKYCVIGSRISAVSQPRVVSVEDEKCRSSKKDCKNCEPGGNINVKMLFG